MVRPAPGTRQYVQRATPRDQWRTQERPELRIVSEDVWHRVEARRTVVATMLPSDRRRRLMRGRNAALHSPHLFSGFMRCAVCQGAWVTVTGGKGSPRYGCLRSWRNGVDACTNRLTIRAKIVDAHLLARLKVELEAPATLAYVTEALATALNQRLDARPQLLTEAKAAREQAQQRLQRLVDAIEQGVAASTLAGAIAERQTDLERLDAILREFAEPLQQRLAVMPAWVRQQLEDLTSLLSETPERTKLEFQRLGLRVTMVPIHDEGARPFYRADVAASLPMLAGVGTCRRISDLLPVT